MARRRGGFVLVFPTMVGDENGDGDGVYHHPRLLSAERTIRVFKVLAPS